VVGLALVSVLALTIISVETVSAQQAGATLTANQTATGHSTQVFSWDMSNTVSHDTWHLPAGETGTSQNNISDMRQHDFCPDVWPCRPSKRIHHRGTDPVQSKCGSPPNPGEPPPDPGAD
jgi:hypothetical protein